MQNLTTIIGWQNVSSQLILASAITHKEIHMMINIFKHEYQMRQIRTIHLCPLLARGSTIVRWLILAQPFAQTLQHRATVKLVFPEQGQFGKQIRKAVKKLNKNCILLTI